MAKTKTMTHQKTARKVKRGDVLRTDGTEEVVRSVGVILHMANGVDLILEPDEMVTEVEDPDPEVED